jgi:hypothetical protein
LSVHDGFNSAAHAERREARRCMSASRKPGKGSPPFVVVSSETWCSVNRSCLLSLSSPASHAVSSPITWIGCDSPGSVSACLSHHPLAWRPTGSGPGSSGG